MKFSTVLLTCCVLVLGNATAATENLGGVYEVGSGRIGNHVVRHVKRFGTTCLEVQVISPDNAWKVLSTKRFCTFQGKSFDTDFSHAGFEDISIQKDGLHLTLDIIPLRPTKDEKWACVIPVEGIVIKEMTCAEARKP